MSKKFAIDWSGAQKEMEALDAKKDFTDKRLFVHDFNKQGTSETVIRFLPSRDTAVPFVKMYNHSFENKGMWYIENCRSTIEKGTRENPNCPVCSYNSDNWDDYTEQQQKDRKRKVSYYGNILIVKDPLHPENNGRVFLYRYGYGIHEKIMERSKPKDGSIIDPCQIWDWYDGQDFKLIIKKKDIGEGKKPQNNYDSSCFMDTSTPVGTDEQIEKIIPMLYSLKDFYDPKNFKSFKDCETRFNSVIATKGATPKRAENAEPPVTDTVEEDAIENTESVFAQISDED